ncbi:hypothetical protein GCM10027176_06670 [Actinoallomurus bryophytorum]|uniref:Abortive infection protein n=1 Tax=Actinoallomurus bryophytorum TaxID=1490222 RepID=A0A543CP13_9ACTN|nr:hypothetical protein [Actinoallomurus bryophytorum]TQL98848.1 hypothetical protein FB559_4482 [Actinoallomurus bryophytorum]
MRRRGINYDTGFFPGGRLSRERFDRETAGREMAVIADELHCTAVRITGGDAERLAVAGRCAAEAGLEVWFAPFPSDLTPGEMLPFFEDCADHAEEIRRGGAEVVFVTGCELSLFAAGFLPGEDIFGRLEGVMSGDPAVRAAFGTLTAKVNEFLAEAAAAVRGRFGGQVTYASGTWEDVDWTPFDIVAVDAYRDESNAGGFAGELRRRVTSGKPVVVTEFGCCTYRGAAGRGGTGWMIVDRDAEPLRIDGAYVRDESEQVTYLRELLEIFEQEGVDGAFWFTFAGYGLPHRADPEHDLDLGSYGVVKVGEDGVSQKPKEVFHALAAAYAR